MLNHAGDGDLKELIHEAITTSQEEMKEVAELLKENGVGLHLRHQQDRLQI